MKKKVFAIAVIVLALSVLAAGTLAYFTDEAEVHNVITSGAVNIEVEEWQDTEDGRIPYPDDPVGIMPGTDLSKIVTVKNLEAQSWIRAKITVVITDADGDEMDLTAAQLDAIMDIDLNTEDWTEGEDGWYYYNAPLGMGEATAPLFESIHFSGPNMTNEYQNCTVEVIVDAQATQTANNGSSALEAKGWPAE